MLTGDKTERPNKIAFVITELDVGGAERCLTNLAVRLDRQRFQPQVFVLAPRPGPSKDALVRELEHCGIGVEFLGARSLVNIWSTYCQLRDRLREQRPTFVQTFLFHANVLGAYAAKAARVPWVITGIRVADPSRWRQYVERRSSRLVQHVVCVSESVATHARLDIGIPDEKLVVIPNGVDLVRVSHESRTDPLRPPIGPGKKILTVVGRLHRQKGIDWLLNALPLILRTRPDVELVIVGRGPAEAELRELANQLQVSQQVHFLGWREDVPAILASSDLFVLPSRWEGMANALLEAMASGLPVVATRVEGVEEVMSGTPAGQIVDFGDTPALVEGIASILGDPLRSKELGAANRKRSSAFSLDQMVNTYQSLYERLTGSPSGP